MIGKNNLIAASTTIVTLVILSLDIKPATAQLSFRFGNEDRVSIPFNDQIINGAINGNLSSLVNNTMPSLNEDNGLFIRFGSPGSDILFDDSSTLLFGRIGNDRLIGANPADANPDLGKRDILLGGPDFVVGFIDGEGTTNGPDNNLYVLGDENNPYYVGGGGPLGSNDFALILSFQSDKDFIRLNGNPENYSLANFGTNNQSQGTAIFLNDGQPDLVALLPGISDLSLDSNSFEFDNAPPPSKAAVEQVTQFGTVGGDFASGVATDNDGNVYIAGLTSENLAATNAGSRDGFVAKFDNNGNPIWTQQFGSESAEDVLGVVTDSNNNVYVAGFTLGDLGGSNAGERDAFIVKFDSDGNQVGIIQFGTPNRDFAFDIDLDNEANLIVSGYTEESGDINVYAAKFNTDLEQIFLNQYGTPEDDETFGIRSDQEGNLYQTGWTTGDFGGENAGLYDAWLSKLDSDGNLLWVQQFGTPDFEFGWDVATDSFGNIYSTGWTLGDLGDSNLGSYDAFLTKFDPEGNLLWIEQFGSPGVEQAFALEISSDDIIYVAGYTDDSFGAANAGGDSIGGDDPFLAKFDLDGNLLEVSQFGSSGVDRAFDLDVKFVDQVWLAGATDGSLGSENIGFYDAWVTQINHVNCGGKPCIGSPSDPKATPEPSALISFFGLAILTTVSINKKNNGNTQGKRILKIQGY
jgi:hypothetical protein